MTDSTAESTEANANTLRLELLKVLTEIFHDGVGRGGGKDHLVEADGVLNAIDEAVTRILTCLGKVESKKPPVEVPKEFICKLSKTIMIEPVIIASGQTFEKKHITKWLKHNTTCPETKAVLSHLCLTPNHSISELITQWCLVNKYDRPDPQPSDETVIEMFTGDIEPLLHRISSPSSVADQIEAAKELALQTSKFVNVREFFVKELHDSITRLLTPLSNLGDDVDSNPELQENILTSLLNISTVEKSQKVIAENPLVIPLLTKSLRKGTDQTKTVSAATLTSLSGIDSNKIIIGNSEALKALIDLIGDSDDLLATGEAGYAILNLCFDELENAEKAVSEGLILTLLKKIVAGRNVENMVSILASISTNNRAKDEIEELGIVCDILKILRNPSCLLTGENAIEILFNMFDRIRGTARLGILQEEELLYKTFTKLARQGSDRAARKAQEILQWMEMFAEKERRQTMLEFAALN